MTLQTLKAPFATTLTVWKALFLREALTRVGAKRGSWFWLIAEPVMHMGYLMYLYTVIRARSVGSIDVMMWLMLGLLGFFMFRRTSTQTMNAIIANRSLFAYRQVKPIDSVLVRAGLEAVEMVVVIAVLFASAALLGRQIVPADPLLMMVAFAGLWLLGLGLGLMSSVANELLPEFGRILGMTMMPLYLLSGVIMPIGAVPEPYRSWLLFNPVAHGLELIRLAYATHYHVVDGVSLAYVYAFALVLVFLGLLLHRRFAQRLVME